MNAPRMASMAVRLAALGLLLGAVPAAGCRYDPVQQDKIDALAEESGTPSDLHRPGEPCVACHSTYEGATPAMAVGGTVYALDAEGVARPAVNAYVTVTDSAGDSRGLCTNGAGNFYVKKDDWAEIAFPLQVQVGNRRMRSLVGRDGSCASCHKLPDEKSLVPATGAGRDSAGVVLVDLSVPDMNCGGAP